MSSGQGTEPDLKENYAEALLSSINKSAGMDGQTYAWRKTSLLAILSWVEPASLTA